MRRRPFGRSSVKDFPDGELDVRLNETVQGNDVYLVQLTGLPVAYIYKIRRSGDTMRVQSITGEVAGRSPVVVDDMISTGGTKVSAVDALLENGCRPRIILAATHGLLVF